MPESTDGDGHMPSGKEIQRSLLELLLHQSYLLLERNRIEDARAHFEETKQLAQGLGKRTQEALHDLETAITNKSGAEASISMSDRHLQNIAYAVDAALSSALDAAQNEDLAATMGVTRPDLYMRAFVTVDDFLQRLGVPLPRYAVQKAFSLAWDLKTEQQEDPATGEGPQSWHEEALKNFFTDSVRTTVQAHIEAIRAIEVHRHLGKPFALYLRSFSSEAYSAIVETSAPLILGTDTLLQTTDPEWYFSERRLAESLSPSVQLLTVTNPSSLPGLHLARLPRLALGEDWRQTVVGIAQEAAFVIFALDELSPGVMDELAMLDRLGKNDTTVIVLPSKKPPESPYTRWTVASGAVQVLGGSLPIPVPPASDDDRLKKFQHVITLDRITDHDPARLQVFRYVLRLTKQSRVERMEKRLADLSKASKH